MRNNVITYTVNKTVNTDLYISVQNGEVVVKAPWYFSNNQIQQVVEQKKNWILQKLAEYEISSKYPCSHLQILGRTYEVQVNYKIIKMPTLDIEGRNIKITLPIKYKKLENKETIQTLIQKMYQMIAEKEIETIMEKTRVMTGLAPEDYQIQELNGKLATCLEHKTILVNPSIVAYSKETIEYIILHEFCHLTYKNHSKGFKTMLEKYMPDYRYHEKILEKEQY